MFTDEHQDPNVNYHFFDNHSEYHNPFNSTQQFNRNP